VALLFSVVSFPVSKETPAVQVLMTKPEEERLHSMLDEKFWGVDVDEESGLVYGPFKHAFSCLAKYISAIWKMRNVFAHPVQGYDVA
jgi:hypothetical protein